MSYKTQMGSGSRSDTKKEVQSGGVAHYDIMKSAVVVEDKAGNQVLIQVEGAHIGEVRDSHGETKCVTNHVGDVLISEGLAKDLNAAVRTVQPIVDRINNGTATLGDKLTVAGYAVKMVTVGQHVNLSPTDIPGLCRSWDKGPAR